MAHSKAPRRTDKRRPTRSRTAGDATTEGERLADEVWHLRERIEVLVAELAAERLSGAGIAASDAAKTRLLATAAHEIRTPLAAMTGMADLLIAEPLSPAQGAYARAILTSGQALLSFVDDILDLSRLAADKLEIRPEPVDLGPLVEDIIELIAPRAQLKGLEIVTRIDGRLPARLSADPGRLRQVLLNLAGNAIKFTQEGGVAVEVAEEGPPGPLARLRFSVRDTGPGVPPEARERIFEAFAQGETRAPGSAGLGLAISRAIVRAMGGDIAFDDGQATGACFSFVIDLPVVDPRPWSSAELAGLEIGLLVPGRLEEEALTDRLRTLGATTYLAARPDEARPTRAAAIIVDETLADAAEPWLRAAPPAIVLLAPADRHTLAQLRQAGFRGHLIKPVRMASLAKVVRAVAAGDSVAVEGPSPPLRDAERPGTGLRALLVEDDPVSALIARTHLQRLGFDVVELADGVAAVAMAASIRGAAGAFDLALIDLNLPGRDGPDVIRALRMGGAAGRIVALTADPSRASEAAAIAAGADSRLAKPLDAGQLSSIAVGLSARRGPQSVD